MQAILAEILKFEKKVFRITECVIFYTVFGVETRVTASPKHKIGMGLPESQHIFVKTSCESGSTITKP